MSERGEKRAREALERMFCMLNRALFFFSFWAPPFHPLSLPFTSLPSWTFPVCDVLLSPMEANKRLHALIERNCFKFVIVWGFVIIVRFQTMPFSGGTPWGFTIFSFVLSRIWRFSVSWIQVNNLNSPTIVRIGTQCVHVSAIQEFSDHLGKKATHLRERRLFEFCRRSLWVSLWTLESEVREWAYFSFLSLSGIS